MLLKNQTYFLEKNIHTHLHTHTLVTQWLLTKVFLPTGLSRASWKANGDIGRLITAADFHKAYQILTECS